MYHLRIPDRPGHLETVGTELRGPTPPGFRLHFHSMYATQTSKREHGLWKYPPQPKWTGVLR